MTDNRFVRVTLNIEECGGKRRMNETRCAGYYTDDGKKQITACVGRSMLLPAVTNKKRIDKRAA